MPNDPCRGRAGRRASLIAAVLLTLFVLQCFNAARQKSVTFDEPYYISSGYAYLTRGAFDLNPEHPPLMKYLIALPLLALDLKPVDAVAGWSDAVQAPQPFGANFLYENALPADDILFAARCSAVLIGTLTGLIVWRWAAALFGHAIGIFTLALFTFCPNMTAYSSVATLDIGLAFGVVAAGFASWRLLRRPTPIRAVMAGLALAAAMLMRFIAVGWAAVILLCVVVCVRRSFIESVTRRNAEAARRARRIMIHGFAAFAVALIVIGFAYGPAHLGFAEYAHRFDVGVIHRANLTDPTYESFCFGQYSAGGFWWGFLAAFIVKTPLPVLILIGASPLLALARRRSVSMKTRARRFGRVRRARRDDGLPWAGVVLFFIATALVRWNPCIRYILPVYPLLFVAIAPTLRDLWHRGRTTRAALIALMLWMGMDHLSAGPDYLAYFNAPAGGSAGGIRYLDDSNIDWGQDLKPLAAYAKERNLPGLHLVYHPVYLAAQGARYYGLPCVPMTVEEIHRPRPGWYAVSAHLLQRLRLFEGSDVRFDWLRRFKPVTRIGGSIYLYHFSETPSNDPADLPADPGNSKMH